MASVSAKSTRTVATLSIALRVFSREEEPDEARPGVQELSRRPRVRLGVPFPRKGQKSGGGGVKDEGNRLLRVGPDGDRGRMVGQHQNGQVASVSGPVEDGRPPLPLRPPRGPGPC